MRPRRMTFRPAYGARSRGRPYPRIYRPMPQSQGMTRCVDNAIAVSQFGNVGITSSLAGVAQGDGIVGRDGNVCNILQIQLQFGIKCGDTATSYNVALVWDNSSSTAGPGTYNTIFAMTNNAGSGAVSTYAQGELVSLTFRERFTIIKRWHGWMEPTSAGSGPASIRTVSYFKKFIPPLVQHYIDNSANPDRGQLVLCYRSDNTNATTAAPDLRGSYRYRYVCA